MLNKALHTFVSRVSAAAGTLLLVVVTSRYLGAQGRGEISLITLAIALIMLGNDYLSGSALVYFTPRKPLRSLVVPAYLWALLLCLLAVPVFFATDFLPAYLIPQVAVVALLFCLLSAHYSVLLGRQMINQRNMLQMLVALLQLFLVLACFSWVNQPTVQWYVNMQYVTMTLCLVLSVFMLGKMWKKLWRTDEERIPFIVPEHVRYGLISQTGNLVIFMAYRFNYKVLEHYYDTAELGIYATAVTLAEALLMVSQSVAMVQHAHIVNSGDDKYRVKLATRNFRLVLVLLVAGALFLALVPGSWYSLLLGNDFTSLKPVLLCLLPGIFFLGLSSVISHYYAGTARFRTMLYANTCCFLAVAAGGLLLIPGMKSTGAALAQSFAYGLLLLFYVVVFVREKKLNIASLLPGRGFLSDIKQDIR